ncbi:MAG: hypothetical protein QM791_11695 [Ferruginibacter sp.]
MKKILIAALALVMSATAVTAQTSTPAKKEHNKAKTTAVATAGKTSETTAAPVTKKDGTPDKRFKANKHLKKDGTADKRFKDHKKTK